MKTVRRWVVICLLPTFLLLSSFAAKPGESLDADAMFGRFASAKLTREFARPGVSYLLYDMRNGRYVASHWNGSKQPVPVGSLVKPFTALAYAESHDFRFPEHECIGGSSCWLRKGHGNLGIVQAIAMSCNSYFAELASHTGAAQVATVAHRYGLNGPPANATPEGMAGGYGEWRESPEGLLLAYASLLQSGQQPAIHEIVDGMAQAARSGTASGLSRPDRQWFLAKTGTAPCTHHPHAPGDGFVIVAWPADLPRYIMLVREHGVPGAKCAELAGRILRSLEL